MLPVQIYADSDRSLEETNKYLEYAFEPVVRAQFEKLIDGTYGEQLDALAISNSTDVVIRIFLYLRELHRLSLIHICWCCRYGTFRLAGGGCMCDP